MQANRQIMNGDISWKKANRSRNTSKQVVSSKTKAGFTHKRADRQTDRQRRGPRQTKDSHTGRDKSHIGKLRKEKTETWDVKRKRINLRRKRKFRRGKKRVGISLALEAIKRIKDKWKQTAQIEDREGNNDHGTFFSYLCSTLHSDSFFFPFLFFAEQNETKHAKKRKVKSENKKENIS